MTTKKITNPVFFIGLCLALGILAFFSGEGGFVFFSKKSNEVEDKKRAWTSLLTSHPYYAHFENAAKSPGKIPDREPPDLAMEQDHLMTMDPRLGKAPRERLLAAGREMERKLREKTAIPGIDWQERGPLNVGGRTRALLFDPNDASGKKLWAGGVSGGLWYTDDITASPVKWTHVDDFWDNIAVGCIAYNPANTQEFYVGTGEGWYNADAQGGGGVWKTSDGGLTWSLLPSTAPGAFDSDSHFHYVNKIVVKKNGTIFAATRGYYTDRGGIMRSADGGTTWTRVLSIFEPEVYNDWAADLELAANGDVYASFGIRAGGQVYKTSNADDGKVSTWTNLSAHINMGEAKRVELACAPSDPNVLYAVASGGAGKNDIEWFKKTTDGGATWSSLPIPKLVDDGLTHFTRGQAWYDLILAVHPDDPDLVIAGGIDLHRTTDGGASWTGISHWHGGYGQPEVHTDQHAIQFRPGHPDEVVFGNDGGLYYSSNAGENGSVPVFIPKNNGYNVTQFYACAAKNEVNSHYFLAGSQDNGTQQFKLPQQGITTEVTGGDGAFCHIDQIDPRIQITQHTFNTIYRSLDGGQTFFSLEREKTGFFINPSEYDSQRKIFYSAADDDELKRISGMDGSFTIAELPIPVGGAKVSALKISPYNDVLFLGVANGRVYRYADAGSGSPTLSRIDNGSLPITTAGWVSSIDIGVNDDHLMVTYSNYGVLSVWETTDGGLNWYSKEGNLPDIPVRWAIYNPDNRDQVLLATELGVWTTDDFGPGTSNAPDWGPSNADLAHTRVTMLKYRPADKMVAGSTHGRGLFTSDVFVNSSLADFLPDNTISCAGSLTVNFTDGSLQTNNSWAWDIDNDGAVDYTIQNPTHTYHNPGIYSVKLAVNMGNAQTVKNQQVLVMDGQPTINTGCTPSSNFNTNNSLGTGIYQFKLANINHRSSNNDGHYQDYVCTQWTPLEGGAAYEATITTGSVHFEGAQVYIDYNDNGIFETREAVLTFPSGRGTRTLSFTTPTSGLVQNKGLRMRVLSRYFNPPSNACDTGPYGQAEDYTVYFATASLLPVSLVEFKAECEGNAVAISWKTASEQHNDHFTVERSAEGLNWEIVGKVKGAGTSTQGHRYNMKDHGADGGVNYYRLKQSDLDGKYSYSDVLSVSCVDLDQQILTLFPNPSPGRFTIQGFGQEADLTITNAMGQRIMNKKIISDEEIIDLTGRPGTYIVVIRSGGKAFSRKVFIK